MGRLYAVFDGRPNWECVVRLSNCAFKFFNTKNCSRVSYIVANVRLSNACAKSCSMMTVMTLVIIVESRLTTKASAVLKCIITLRSGAIVHNGTLIGCFHLD